MHKFTSTVDAKPFLAASSCLVADKNSLILILHSFLVSSSNTLFMAVSVSLSKVATGSRFDSASKNSALCEGCFFTS